MLFFNLKILEQQTASDDELVASLKAAHSGKTMPRNRKDRFKPIKDLRRGNSFLINPGQLFNSNIRDNTYLAQYIRLAGRRDVTLYIQYGVRYLSRDMFPDLNIQAIKTNPLLTITQDKIYFKYEGN